VVGLLPNYEHRALGVVDNFIGGSAKDPATDWVMRVRAENNQIGPNLFDDAQSLFARLPVADMSRCGNASRLQPGESLVQSLAIEGLGLLVGLVHLVRLSAYSGTRPTATT